VLHAELIARLIQQPMYMDRSAVLIAN
jgi:hypothetical protein